MSLVGYEFSDDDSDDDRQEFTPVLRKNVIPEADKKDSQVGSGSTLIKAVKSASGKMQILAPDFDLLDSSSDEDESKPKLKNIKPSATGSGLRSILPPARGSSSNMETVKTVTSLTSLVPQSLKRSTIRSDTAATPVKRVKDDIEIDGNNFFSLADDDERVPESVSVPVTNERLISSVDLTPAVKTDVVHDDEAIRTHAVPVAAASDMSDLQFKKLISNRFGDECTDEIDLVDVNVNQHLTQSTEYLKSVTTERDRKDDDQPQPNSTVRRKHHITYLAHEAKQREIALKEEWARNKATRNQSRAKYGF